jgi:hypothetical protein
MLPLRATCNLPPAGVMSFEDDRLLLDIPGPPSARLAFEQVADRPHHASSKVSTTSWSRRKSRVLKCWNPKPGPPAVSISTTRATPMPLGLAQAACCHAAARAGGDTATGAGAAAETVPVVGATGRTPKVWVGATVADCGAAAAGAPGVKQFTVS